jgi:anti-sigma factor RsiW
MAMTATSDAPSERDEIEMLLPWYVTGRLDDADRTRVAAWLARDPSLARQLALIEEERQSAVAASEAMASAAQVSAGRVLASLPQRRNGSHSWSARVAAWIDDTVAGLSPAGLRWAAAAAVLVIAVQAVGLAMLAHQPGGGGSYETASGPLAVPTGGVFVLVRPAEGATVAALAMMLKEMEATIAGGPSADGLLRIRIGAADLGEADQRTRIDRLRARGDVIQLVLPEPARRP